MSTEKAEATLEKGDNNEAPEADYMANKEPYHEDRLVRQLKNRHVAMIRSASQLSC